MEIHAENNLKKIRIEKGFNQDVIARVLDTTRQRYARMENGHADISLSELEKIAAFYQVSIRELTDHGELNKSFLSLFDESLTQAEELKRLDRLLTALKEQEKLFHEKNDRNVEKKKQKKSEERSSLAPLYRENTVMEEFLYPLSDELCAIYVEGFPLKTDCLLVLNSSIRGIRREMVKMIFETRMQENRRNPKDRIVILSEELNRWMTDRNCQMALRRKLVPRGKLYARMEEWFGLEPSGLRILQTAALSEDFHVDITYMIDTLLIYDMISLEQEAQLKKALRYYKEDGIRSMIGIRDRILTKGEEEGDILIPLHYIDHILMNYENGFLPFPAFAKLMKLCGINVDDLKGLRKPMDDKDNWDDWS